MIANYGSLRIYGQGLGEFKRIMRLADMPFPEGDMVW